MTKFLARKYENILMIPNKINHIIYYSVLHHVFHSELNTCDSRAKAQLQTGKDELLTTWRECQGGY